MKKIFLLTAVTAIIYSCSSNDEKIKKNADTNNQVGVQDGTGNVPDTTNAINLSTHKKDTTQNAKDSMK